MPQPRKLHDEYFLKAKAEGYLARSAYKLLEINERTPVVLLGNSVLDLGCAPGSWVQVASELAGAKGVVVGIDLKEPDPRAADRGRAKVKLAVGDAFDTDPSTLLAHLARLRDEELSDGTRFDSVLSDMAPNTSGHGDDFVSARLCRRVLELVPRVLRPGGHLCMKIFEGAEYADVLRETGRLFVKSQGFKPRASRDVSREMFIIGRSYCGREAVQSRHRKSGPPAPVEGWGGAGT